MKVPKHIKDKLIEIAILSSRIRTIEDELTQWYNKNNIDTNSYEFMDANGYVEGDCCPDYLIEYLESL